MGVVSRTEGLICRETYVEKGGEKRQRRVTRGKDDVFGTRLITGGSEHLSVNIVVFELGRRKTEGQRIGRIQTAVKRLRPIMGEENLVCEQKKDLTKWKSLGLDMKYARLSCWFRSARMFNWRANGKKNRTVD